jgi:hypothetical protein
MVAFDHDGRELARAGMPYPSEPLVNEIAHPLHHGLLGRLLESATREANWDAAAIDCPMHHAALRVEVEPCSAGRTGWEEFNLPAARELCRGLFGTVANTGGKTRT